MEYTNKVIEHFMCPQNAYSIYRLFNFNDDKEKAAKIIQSR